MRTVIFHTGRRACRVAGFADAWCPVTPGNHDENVLSFGARSANTPVAGVVETGAVVSALHVVVCPLQLSVAAGSLYAINFTSGAWRACSAK